MYWVYIIQCLDLSYYTGHTSNLDKRNLYHKSGIGAVWTLKHPIDKLVYCEEHDSLEETIKREKQIKKWSRIKKEKLITGEWKKPEIN